MLLSEKIDLSEWTQLAYGGTRIVYVSDAYPDVVLKVIREEKRGPQGDRPRRSRFEFFRQFRRFGAYLSFSREFDEFLEQARRFSGDQMIELPMARVYGFVHTNMGLGMLSERLRGPNGETAPTLREVLRREGPAQWLFDMLDDCFDYMARHHIVMADRNLDNFVLATDKNGKRRLVCVDGTGDKSAIHIYAVSHWLNARKLARYRRQLQERIEAFVEKEGLGKQAEQVPQRSGELKAV